MLTKKQICLIILYLSLCIAQNVFAEIKNPEGCKDLLIHVNSQLQTMDCKLYFNKDVDIRRGHFLSYGDYQHYREYYREHGGIGSLRRLPQSLLGIAKPDNISSFYLVRNFFSIGATQINLNYKCGGKVISFNVSQNRCVTSAGLVKVHINENQDNYFTIIYNTVAGAYDNKAGEATINISHCDHCAGYE